MAGYGRPGSIAFGGGSLLSSADLSGSAGLWGVISTNTVALATTAGTNHGIILDGGAASGDPVTLAIGHVACIAGDTVAAGAVVTNEVTTARTVTAGSGGSGKGIALTGGADGEIIEVFLIGTTLELLP